MIDGWQVRGQVAVCVVVVVVVCLWRHQQTFEFETTTLRIWRYLDFRRTLRTNDEQLDLSTDFRQLICSVISEDDMFINCWKDHFFQNTHFKYTEGDTMEEHFMLIFWWLKIWMENLNKFFEQEIKCFLLFERKE